MPTKKTTKRAGAAKSARPAASAKSAKARKPAAGKSKASAAGAAGPQSVAQFLKAGPKADGYSAVFLVNPLESTPETLRVAWPETCVACGSWFDFPASAVASVTPLGVEECCTTPFPKAAFKIVPDRDDLIRMLRSHLTGTVGSELGLQAPVQTGGFALTADVEESEVCGAEEEVEEAPQGFGLTELAPAVASAVALELSGPQWVARFPGSRSIFDTKPPFLDKLSKFHAALTAAGASIAISATFRPPERAYLMHHSFMIARRGADPRSVPPMPGVNIQWFHGDLARSKNAAEQMVRGYGIAFKPALRSRHTEGLAIDMSISWSGTLNIKTATGVVRSIGAPRNGKDNGKLHQVGATYGVLKLVSDPPHWSNTGD